MSHSLLLTEKIEILMGDIHMIKEMASNNILSFGLTVFSIIIAIFSTSFAIYVYKKDKTKKRELDKIAKIVGENIDLSEKSDKIKDLSLQLDKLNKIINEEIPIKAKKVALQDRLDRSLEELADCYNNVSEIYRELQFYEENNKDEKISNELFDKISKEIDPKYLINEKLSRYTIILFLSSFIINIVSGIDILDKIWNVFCNFFFIIEGIYVCKILLTYYELRNNEILQFLTFILLAFIAIFAGVFCIILNVIISDFNYILLVYLGYCILSEILFLYALYKVRKRK